MAEEEKVLISRTRVSKLNWNKLNELADALTKSVGTDVSRELLTDLAIKSLLAYYDKFLNRPKRKANESEILSAARNMEELRSAQEVGTDAPPSDRMREAMSRLSNNRAEFMFTPPEPEDGIE